MEPRRHLTRKQAQMLHTIEDFIGRNGYPPSMRELATILHLTPGTVHFHIHSLMKRGYLLHDGTDHGITIVEDSPPGNHVPLLGTLTDGMPFELSPLPLGAVEIPASLEGRASHALEVRGAGLREAGIVEGDLVLVHEQDEVRAGQPAVVVRADGTATVKRVFREPGRFRLESAGFPARGGYVENMAIHGRVVGLLRIY